MTHASPSTGGEAGGDRRGDLQFLGLFAVFSAGVIAVDILSVLHDRAEADHSLSWWEPAVWETSSRLVLVAMHRPRSGRCGASRPADRAPSGGWPLTWGPRRASPSPT